MNRKRNPPPAGPVRVGFVSLGCAKNLVDSQLMAGNLLAEGIALAPSPEEAEVVIVNTCAFIEDARRESLESIRAACRLKRRGPCRAVLVAGCLPQRYRARVLADLPEVDGFIGLDELRDVAGVVRRLAAGERGLLQVSPTATRLFDPEGPGVIFTGGPYAYLKIAEGCNHRCAFCAIPGIRGAHRSRPVDRIVAEAEQMLARGARELVLISQDVTSYGTDRGGGENLAHLLRRLGRIGGTFWIRWLYGYPSHITDELLAAMAEVPQVCRYLDVPIQHADPWVLRAMRRAGTIDAVLQLPDRVRRALPDAALRTTCLVGFPGETEARFRRLLEYLRRSAYDHLGVFVYSPEEGTPAAAMPARPAPAVAEERRERLMLAQQEVVARAARARIGREIEVLLEHPQPPARGGRRGGPGRPVWRARSRREAPEVDGVVLVEGLPAAAASGTFVRVNVTAASAYDLRAVALGPAAKVRNP